MWATRIEQDGTPSDLEPISIATGDANVSPTVAFDGTNHFVAWEVEAFSPPFGIHAARVSPLGELLDGPPSALGLTIDEPGDATLLSRPSILRGAANLLLAWVVNKEISGQHKDLAGAPCRDFPRGWGRLLELSDNPVG